MTKDWDLVQDEIKELSFAQKKPLEEVKELMERKYKFYASTRAYRMKLKEWGLMRHKQRSTNKIRHATRHTSKDATVDNAGCETDAIAVDQQTQEDGAKTSDWQLVASQPSLVADGPDEVTEHMFAGLLDQPVDLQISMDTWSTDSTQPSDTVLDMVEAILDYDLERLGKLLVDNIEHINEPIGSTLFGPTGRFFGHPALSQMVILQHAGQTLFDIACGLPCGPVAWMLLTYGAKGSKHPLGSDLALHNAIKNGRVYTVQVLLQPDRSAVNGLPDSKWTPLRQAVFWMQPEVVRVLLRRGATVEDAGPPPVQSGLNSPLQLCLVRRETNYADPSYRTRCHQILKLLLDAGANVHVTSPDPMVQSTFESFIRPWTSRPYWGFEISQEELECFGMFVSRGANLQLPFHGVPCQSATKETFVHQAIWHSSPTFARSLIDNFVPSASGNGMALLQEILGSCPDAKRHPTDTLRDMQVLLTKVVNPNRTGQDLISPLRKCITDCPAVDLVARLRVLLDAGANPEAQDPDGVQLYVLAAETFDEPLLSEVMSILVAKIPGRHVRVVDAMSYQWTGNIFPISTTQTYEQVMSCSRLTGEFAICLQDMVPEHVRAVFHKAYFTIASNYFLDTMTRLARTRMLDAQEKEEITQITLMRETAGVPAYKFEPDLVVALLHMQPSNMMLEVDDHLSTGDEICSSPVSSFDDTPASSMTLDTATPAASSHTPFQFNPNGTSTLDIPRSAPTSPHPSDDFFTKPSEMQFRVECVLKHECAICNDGKLLTKKELEKHDTEHEHTASCTETLCTRRFCVAKRRSTCEDHLFLGNV
ncbi:uncharacterized protein SETTUDRAFT_172856 [Exserohilum turcica Et28A]|uniref:Clr5 domain-containing protein n=1 Tax=Exserohilum turcicum (strain 28A) TaxID=671987 RepID=R0K0D7_EXST2|nr:uncharacterized protein SETTUDRAFT_172856 [Exserohilum turcica Et28A]EOA83129.1 hypothetical protein SETTUDRAFT_172856 [Exserohilum turcica Et28A]